MFYLTGMLISYLVLKYSAQCTGGVLVFFTILWPLIFVAMVLDKIDLKFRGK